MKISENTSVAMPVRNLISIIAAVALGVWGYFGIVERLNQVETEKILGIKSEDIPKVLGYNRKPELIHRDNMAFFS